MVFLSTLFVLGCAREKVVAKDPFLEKWNTMEKTSQGHSPTPQTRNITIPEPPKHETETGTSGKAEAIPARALPTEKVNLKLRQADIKAVLRALARAAGQNILIKNDIKGDINVDFNNVPWDQAFKSILRTQGLSYAMEGDIIRVMTLDDLEQDLKVSAIGEKRKTQEMVVKMVEPLTTFIINIDYADAKGLRENLQEFLTKDKDGKPRGSIRVDEHSNSLIIQAIRDDLTKMIPLIEKIDRPTYQIQIKANIVETTTDVARNLGIQWGGIRKERIGNQDLFVTPGGTAGSAVPPGNLLSGGYNPVLGDKGLSGQGFGVNFPVSDVVKQSAGGIGSLGLLYGTIGGNILEVQLNLLQKDGKANILSSPSITTLDNQTAFTENGEKVPFVSTSNSGGVAVQEVKFEDAVLRLEITPHVIDGKNLKMKIKVKKDEVDLTRTVQGNPFIIKKQTETSLIVQDGETIVISGLSKQSKTDSSSGIPGLKDVPMVGWMFKGADKTRSMQEVLIFITPTILQPQMSRVLPGGPENSQSAAPD